MKIGILTLAVLTLSGAMAVAQTSRVPKSDNQSWNDIQLTVPMLKKLDLMTQLTLRLGDNATQTADQRLSVGFNYKANKYLSFLPFYTHREARPPNGRHEYEERLTLSGTIRFPVGKFTIGDRNGFERRWRTPQVNAWRYRNLLKIEHPFKMGGKKYIWFVSDEVFYDWSLHVWPRNRAAAGITRSLNKHVTLDLYYTRQNDSHTRPGDLNIVWATWRIKL